MNRGTLRQTLPIAAEVLGLDITNFRERLVDKINEARYLLLTFADAREAFFKESGTTAVQCHRWLGANSCSGDACQTRRQPTYFAITLPPGISQLDDIRGPQDQNLPLFAEYTMGTHPDMGDCAAVRMTDSYYLDVDPPPGEFIYFFPEDVADEGKEIGIEYQMDCCDTKREDIRLSMSGSTTSAPIARILRLTLPMDRGGWIRVMTQDGKQIGRFHPGTAPDRVRYAIHGFGANTPLRWWGTREIATVCFDSDQVEFADPTLWRRLLRFQKLDNKDNRNRSEETAYQSTITFISAQIEQELAKQQGDHEHLNYGSSQVQRQVFDPLSDFQNMSYGFNRKRKRRQPPWKR